MAENVTEAATLAPPAPYSVAETVLIAVMAGTLSMITVAGNIMVILSFKIDKQLQTISNYFLLSLAIADVTIGSISMPLYTIYLLLGYWPFGPNICDMWLALDYLASNASVLNLLMISFDRYTKREIIYWSVRNICIYVYLDKTRVNEFQSTPLTATFYILTRFKWHSFVLVLDFYVSLIFNENFTFRALRRILISF